VVFALGPEDASYYAKILGHVDPKTVSEQVAEARESVGMSEQWERWRQELLGLYQGQAFVAIRSHHRPPLWRRITGLHQSHLYKVATPAMPDPNPDPTLLREVEQQYLRRYFKQREGVEVVFRAPSSAPSRIGRIG